MSDTLTTYLVSVALLAALALFIPCIESLAGLLRRTPQSQDAAPEPKRPRSYKSDVA